jgi:hydroxypyruvate reductase
VGKAAGAMARAALDTYGPLPCLVVTKDGHGAGLPESATLIEASHPVPDARSLAGGRALRAAVAAMEPGSHLMLLVSGGASALAEDLVPGETLDSLAALNRRLLASGLDIGAMNAARRRISRVKGGGLLSEFRGARATVLAISDVPRDEIAVIGSGIGAAPVPCGFDHTCRIVASNAIARAAAAAALDVPILANDESLYDDVEALAPRIGARLRDMPSGALILGGEPTVVLPENPGQGGRNQALALALSREIAGLPGLAVVVGGTDGSDGPTDAAGGIVDGATWGPGAAEALARADSGTWLRGRGALLVSGPTGTNVMDLLIAVKTTA